MTYVLGIDPGVTTGVCLLKIHEQYPAKVTGMREIEGGIEGLIEAILVGGAPDVIVCESFNLDGRTPKPDLTPVEIIGALKAIRRCKLEWRSVELVFQTNTQGKHLMTDDVLRRAGYYPRRGEVKGGHSTDALRHALTYIVKTLKHAPTQEKLWPKN